MISVTILTKDSQELIGSVLESVTWADEVVLLDNGSTDHTVDIAKTFPNVAIHTTDFLGFGPMKNRAAELACHDWILSLDSDEMISPELEEELADLVPDIETVYRMPRRNFFSGRWIRWCGWHPDRCLRFYHRKHTQFSNDQVHESVETDGMKVVNLKGSIDHTSYLSIADFLTKMQRYSTLWAEQNRHRKKGSLPRALWHKWWTFLKSYILKRGFLGGVEGYLISAYNAHTAYYKYMKLRELQKDIAPSTIDDTFEPLPKLVWPSHVEEPVDVPKRRAGDELRSDEPT